jgi:hypothetical protein
MVKRKFSFNLAPVVSA